jgi:hypothetical protein
LKSNTSLFFFIRTYSAGVSLEGKQERWTNLLQSQQATGWGFLAAANSLLHLKQYKDTAAMTNRRYSKLAKNVN